MLVTQEQRRLTREMHLKSPMIKSSDAARVLKISKQRLESYRKKQLVECVRIGGHWRYLLHSLQWLKRNYLHLGAKEKRIFKANHSQYQAKVDMINQLSLENKLGISVEGLPLSNRLKRCLMNDDMQTLKDVVEKTKQELLRIPNLGHKCVNELLAFLDNINLKLEMQFDPEPSNGLANVYKVVIVKTSGMYDSINVNIITDDILNVHKMMSPIVNNNHIKYNIMCLGRAVDLEEADLRINDWLGNK